MKKVAAIKILLSLILVLVAKILICCEEEG